MSDRDDNPIDERTDKAPDAEEAGTGRRGFLAGMAGLVGATMLASCSWQEFFQQQFTRLTKEEVQQTVERLKAEYRAKYGMDFVVGTEAPIDGTLFAYALDIQRCIGCRQCVYGCVQENNLSRDPQIQYIRVLRFKDGNMDLEQSTIYYDPEEVPEKGYYYMPVQCQHCANAPCTKVCPVRATWTEPDGIVVVDYNWCIGCRYCMAACPYMGRWFNYTDPKIPIDQINPVTHYLGNRPRMRNVVEKCTFCIQRVRVGKYPMCVEVCPVGARKFGNLLDPDSEINRIIQTKRVFRLKEELNTQPKFYYFFAT
ncbi:MAG: 4Fe-4S dicluster domain-containing protein [Desulfomonile sp.]|nr:4Fe-4S dicluster domain-containing protein [Desulfomonile sp.]